jgi:flagellar FliL protein
MSEPATAEQGGEGTPGQTTARFKSAMLVRITALLFLVAVIGAECLLASLCLPAGPDSPSATAATAHPEPKAGHAEKDKKDSKDKKEKKDKHAAPANENPKDPHSKDSQSSGEEEADPSDQVEVDLEQFNVTAHLATSNTTMRIEFHLFGVVNMSDKVEFERLVKANQHRLRDQVLVIVRSAQPRDLADAGLGLIKRQILGKTNALLGKPLLREVIVSDFSYIEQ